MKILVSFFVFVLFVVFQSFGQPPGGGLPPGNPVPITGIEILLASGGAYGIYRLTRKAGSKNKKT
ncbi:MAG TPA: hypothetical protein VK589_02290 [Chryseolinea sp.]|nr:hypothetical protein [Chryseolinea sp.]